MNRRALLSARPGSPRLSTFSGYTAFTETTDLSGLSAFTGAGLEEVAPHLYVLRSDTLDAVRLDIVVGAGQGHQDKLLQALFTNRLLREGTRHHTSAELAEKLDYYGAWLELTVSVHHSYLTLYTLKRYACETFALVGEMLHEPLFPEERLRIISANNKSQYLVNRQRADVIARRLFNRAVYGDNHPCGRFAEEKDFDAITRDDLLRFFTTYYRPDNCNIYLAGNVDDHLIEAAKKSLPLTPSQEGGTLAEAQLSFGQNTLSLTSPSLGGGRGEAFSLVGTGEASPVSPRARKLAAEKGINTALIAGSGPHGRIIERDVEAAVAAGGTLTGKARAMMAEGGLEAPAMGSGLAGIVKAGDLKVAKANHTDIAGEGTDFEVVKMSNMRKLIARSMYNSLQNSAQLTHHLGADARRLQTLRKKAKKAYEEGRIDANVTINDLVCYAVVKALQKFPNANSHCLGESMRLFKKVHLGLAVDTERGLMVPTVKNADDLDIIALSKALKQVAEDCKKGGINPDLLSPEAASFTVSNLGNYGVEMFTPIINVPQSAILGVNAIVPRPKDLGGGVYAFVPYIGLSLTYDHRSLDGGEATRFVKQIATEIENLDIEF